MGKISKILFICWLLIFGSVAACAAQESVTVAGFANRVVLTQENGGVLDAFRSAEDVLMDELFAAGKLDVYDKTPKVAQMRVSELALALDLGAGSPVLQDFESDYIIYGFLTNMSIKRSEMMVTNFSAGFDGTSDTVCVNLSCNIVERKTGKKVFVGTSKGESTRVATKAAYAGHMLRLGKESVPEQAAANAVAKAAQALAKKINEAV